MLYNDKNYNYVHISLLVSLKINDCIIITVP